MKAHPLCVLSIAALCVTACNSQNHENFQMTYPLPAYVKLPSNPGTPLPFPTDGEGASQLMYWYDSISTPMPFEAAATSSAPVKVGNSQAVQLQAKDFSATLHPNKTVITRKDKNGNTLTGERAATAADKKMRSYILDKVAPAATKKS